MIDRAKPHCLDGVCRARHGGEDRHRRRIGQGADFFQHPHAIQTGHAQIKQHRINAALRDAGEGGEAIRGLDRVVTEIGERFGEALAQGRIVVGDQDLRDHRAVRLCMSSG